MTEIRRDYSNTFFYKITCKDPNVTDIYIGHTTDFVRRKYQHEYVCNNPNQPGSKCKLYNVIRANEGWKNWSMEFIACHKCQDLTEARKYEQEYFEHHNATLNSVDPLPLRQSIRIQRKNREQKEHKLQEPSPDTICEVPLEKTNGNLKALDCKRFVCEKCDFQCSKASNYNKHLLTRKHKRSTVLITETKRKHTCICGKQYKHLPSLSRHKRTCREIFSPVQYTPKEATETSEQSTSIANSEFKDICYEILNQNRELLKQMTELTSKLPSK